MMLHFNLTDSLRCIPIGRFGRRSGCVLTMENGVLGGGGMGKESEDEHGRVFERDPCSHDRCIICVYITACW